LLAVVVVAVAAAAKLAHMAAVVVVAAQVAYGRLLFSLLTPLVIPSLLVRVVMVVQRVVLVVQQQAPDKPVVTRESRGLVCQLVLVVLVVPVGMPAALPLVKVVKVGLTH
jgi:hypothetical protein